MIKRTVCEEALARAMSTGADYAEIFAEHTPSSSVYMVDRHIEEASSSITAPLAVFMMITPSFIFVKASLLIRPLV